MICIGVVILGYSGWSEKQLKKEITLNSWRVVDNITNATWIKKSTNNLWRDQMKAMGGKYLIWSNAPENPNWN
jgi:putative transcriptional regulator